MAVLVGHLERLGRYCAGYSAASESTKGRRRRKGSKSNPTPTLAQTNHSINLLGGSKEERCWFKKRRKEEAKERKAGRKEKEEKEEEQLVEEGIG